jgi:hypothetical protein
MSNVYCDRFKFKTSQVDGCDGVYLDLGGGTPSDDHLRAAGWHVWRGTLHSGCYAEVRLCRRCTGSTRPVVPQVLDGQQELFEIEQAEPSHRMP